jgi:thiamine monophosphate kinase
MDVSDGLAWDLFRMARSSQVRARLRHVPIHPDSVNASVADGKEVLWHALHDGEDHELIAVMHPEDAKAALALRARSLSGLTLIGEMEKGAGLMMDSDLTGKPAESWSPALGGWRHGS